MVHSREWNILLRFASTFMRFLVHNELTLQLEMSTVMTRGEIFVGDSSNLFTFSESKDRFSRALGRGIPFFLVDDNQLSDHSPYCTFG